jgi:hypothetical protein
MRNWIFSFYLVALLSSCISVEKFNANVDVLRDESGLKSDVDYTNGKLRRFHPDLYRYVSRDHFEFKLDSLKASLQDSMTSNDFFLKLSPELASIGQGHMKLFPLMDKRTVKEKRSNHKYDPLPLSQFDYEIFDNKLFIIKNNSKDSSIHVGSEVLSINNQKPQDLISIYRPSISSDGYNQTYFNNTLSHDFPSFYYCENGYPDSVYLLLNFTDTLQGVLLKQGNTATKGKSVYQRDEEKRIPKKIREPLIKLSYLDPEGSIALLKIREFLNGNFHSFYRKCFRQLEEFNTKYLILDLRDNPGGNVMEANELYSYLADSNYYFIDKPIVTSRTSVLHTPYFSVVPFYGKVILAAFLPFRVMALGADFFRVRKADDGKYYYSSNSAKLRYVKENHFEGKVYVIINGGSFSASCLLSSNLKAGNQALFVGEETGGAANGFVSGKISVCRLPESRLHLVFGLMYIQPFYKTGMEGRGIMPDIEIKPTLEDRIRNIDPELKWIVEDIQRHSSP